jgi:hypothetical protein
MGEESVSDSEPKLSVSNRGTELIMRLRFGLVLKLGRVSRPVSTIGIGMGSRFCFSVYKYGS